MACDDLWGPWIAHDCSGCPVKYRFVHVVYEDGDEWMGVMSIDGGPTKFGFDTVPGGEGSWSGQFDYVQIVRYRVRRSLSFDLLEALVHQRRPTDTSAREPI